MRTEVRSKKSEVKSPMSVRGKGPVVAFVSCFLFLVSCFAFSTAQEPEKPQPEKPVGLKKKPKPRPVELAPEEKPDEKPETKPKDDKDDEPETKETAQDPKEVLKRLGENMRAAEDRLAKKDPGERTRDIQGEILKDLDALIEQSKQQQQQQQQSGGSSASRSREQKEQREASDANRQKNQSPNQKTGREQKPQPQPREANQSGQGGTGKEGMSKIADLYKDIWGHLPETMRQEMDAYARERFMSKYRGLLEQYYTNLAAEKNRPGNGSK